MEDLLVLVDKHDNETGTCEKLKAHKKALLHRAFSVFIFRRVLLDNPDGTRTFHIQLLIQKRAKGKYHSAGLWANSCCSHPRAGENIHEAAERRLAEETGIKVGTKASVSNLEEAGTFIYRADFENGLTEYEFDHVFIGWLNPETVGKKELELTLHKNPDEVEDLRFEDVSEIIEDVLLNTSKYAAWFMPALMIATEGREFDFLNKGASERIIY